MDTIDILYLQLYVIVTVSYIIYDFTAKFSLKFNVKLYIIIVFVLKHAKHIGNHLQFISKYVGVKYTVTCRSMEADT